MKLYATVTSERASKGQGGNKEITATIDIGGKEKPVTVVRVTVFALENGLYELTANLAGHRYTAKIQDREAYTHEWDKETMQCKKCGMYYHEERIKAEKQKIS